MEHRHRVLDGGLGGGALDGLDDYALGLFVGVDAGIVHNVVDVGSGGSLGLVLKRLDELLLGFFGRHPRDVLEGLAGVGGEGVQLGFLYFESGKSVVEATAFLVYLVAHALVLALLLVEGELALLLTGLGLLHLCHALVGGLFGVAGNLHGLFAAFKNFAFLQVLAFAFGVGDNLFCAGVRHVALHKHRAQDGQADGDNRYC